MPKFMLEGPQPCTIFWFAFIQLHDHELRKNQSSWLVPYSGSKQLLRLDRLVHSQNQKLYRLFHNHFALLTI